MGHSCYLRNWQQSTTSPLSTRTCWQTTDTTPSMCGRTALSTYVASISGGVGGFSVYMHRCVCTYVVVCMYVCVCLLEMCSVWDSYDYFLCAL